MQPIGINPNLVRLLTATAPDLMSELLTPGKVLEAEVISVYQDKAVLAFGRGARLEVTLQTPLQEGQRVRVEVQGEAKAAPLILKIINQAPAPAPPATQTALPQVLWLPIPLPGGNQGWAQLQIQEDDSPRARALRGGPVQQVRIWWETPALGPVQVTLEAGASSLAALFTSAAPETKGLLDQSLGQLQQRLAETGFPEARLACRVPAPGEAVEPVRIDGANRLDKRL